MAAIRALLAGENAHPRGQIESEKTHNVDSSGKAEVQIESVATGLWLMKIIYIYIVSCDM